MWRSSLVLLCLHAATTWCQKWDSILDLTLLLEVKKHDKSDNSILKRTGSCSEEYETALHKILMGWWWATSFQPLETRCDQGPNQTDQGAVRYRFHFLGRRSQTTSPLFTYVLKRGVHLWFRYACVLPQHQNL